MQILTTPLTLVSPDMHNVNTQILGRFAGSKITKVLLVRPPDVDKLAFNFEAGLRKRHSNYPPYGLLVLAANLRRISIEVACADLHLEVLKKCFESERQEDFKFDDAWQSALDAEILRFNPDLICVTCMFTMTHNSFVLTSKRAAVSGIPIAIGGVHVSNDVDHVLDQLPEVDFAFLKEADLSLPKFVSFVNGMASVDDLSQLVVNVVAKDGERLRMGNESRPTAGDLDIIPAYDLVDIPAYSKYGIMGSAHFMKPDTARFATVLANRGCRAKCTFCSVSNFNGKSVRSRSVSSVVDEIEILRDSYGIEHIMWLDDDLLYDHDRTINLFNEMVRRNLGITWDAGNGVLAASCTHEVIAAAVESGCLSLTIGMESGNRSVLRQIRKPASPETLLKAADVLRQYPSIFVRVFLMLGFPGESIRAVRDTIDLAEQMNLDWHTITKLQGLPSTEIYKDLTASGRFKRGDDTRYSLNTYGHNRREDVLLDFEAFTPETLLDAMDQNSTPSSEELDALWFVMNYIVNFRRMFNESRPQKLGQLLTFTKHIADTVAPEHGFALYFQSYLEHKLKLSPTLNIAERLRRQLESSPSWGYWFRTFGLSVNDVEHQKFSVSLLKKHNII